MNIRTSERGQAMVLIIFAIVGIFAFAALAIDMGQLYSMRRQAQSAADAAALAAAYEFSAASEDRETAINQGFTLAFANGFDNNEETNWVVVNNPPIGGPYCGPCGDPEAMEYFQVQITVRLQPVFAQFFYNGAQETTVEAIAHAKQASSVTTGDALLAMGATSDAMDFNGNITVEIDGGNIRSNGGMIKNGGSGGISVYDGSVYYATTFNGHEEVFNVEPVDDPAAAVGAIPAPSCPTAAEASTWPSQGGVRHNTFDEVDYYYYSSGLSVENLPPGIHCIKGGIGKGNYTGQGVLIVLLSGEIKQTGNDSFDFRSAVDMKDRNGTQWGGMVFYAPESNTSTLKFGGNSEMYIQGSWYAPGAACDIGGTEDGVAYHTAFMCKTFKFHGNPVTQITYRPEELFHFPPVVELVQ